MTLHKFTCTECDGKPFFTDFAPIYDEGPAFCPCCGKDAKVSYVGQIQLMEVMKRVGQSEVA